MSARAVTGTTVTSSAIPIPTLVLMTLIHDIDLALWATGSGFRTVLARRSGGPGCRSMTAVMATTATGATCDLRTAWTFPDGDLPPDRLEAVGDRGSVELTVGEALQVLCRGTPHGLSSGRGGRSFYRVGRPVAERTRAFPGLRPRPVARACARSRRRARRIEARGCGDRVSQPEPGGHPRRMRFADAHIHLVPRGLPSTQPAVAGALRVVGR